MKVLPNDPLLRNMTFDQLQWCYINIVNDNQIMSGKAKDAAMHFDTDQKFFEHMHELGRAEAEKQAQEILSKKPGA